MSAEASSLPPHQASTSIRKMVLAIAMSMSVLLYLDRFAVTIALEAIREDLRMTQTQMSWLISAFFWSYALCQVPAGWLSDRFGARLMLTLYILAWSAFTGLMGLAHSVWLLLWLRLLCGISQAGAYPTAVGLIRMWYPISQRGTASAIVGLGGRIGGALAPLLTAWVIVCFVSAKPERPFDESDVLDTDAFLARFYGEEQRETKNGLESQRQQFIAAFLRNLPEAKRAQFVEHAQVASEALAARRTSVVEDSSSYRYLYSVFEDWLPGVEPSSDRIERTSADGLIHELSTRMSAADFIDLAKIPVSLPKHGKLLLDRRTSGTELTAPETYRLNRLAMEKLFPDEVMKLEGQGWRETMVLYGILGIAVAVAFWFLIRNTPQQHPWCNGAEVEFINRESAGLSAGTTAPKDAFPWRAFLSDLSLWGNSCTQFLTNVGWLFILSSLPRYLEKVHDVPLVMRGVMTTFPIGTGILGMFLGGRWTDWAVREFGLKWGRRIPLVGSRFTASAGYGICLAVSLLIEPDSEKWWLPWMYIGGLCLVSASADFGTPSIWAYCQDVGGKYTASILGWGNMWGNLGAAVAPFFYNRCLGEKPLIQDWNNLFILGGGVFFLSGLSAMLLDATRPLTIPPSKNS